MQCVVVGECICFNKKKREGEIEDRGEGCRKAASSVVGGRDWRERERESDREKSRERRVVGGRDVVDVCA